MFGSEGPKQHINGHRVRLRQVSGEGACDVSAAVEQFELLEATARLLDERARREVHMGAPEVRGKISDQVRRKKCLERVCHRARTPAFLPRETILPARCLSISERIFQGED